MRLRPDARNTITFALIVMAIYLPGYCVVKWLGFW